MSTVSGADTSSNRQVMLSLAYLAYCGDQITTSNPNEEIGDLITAGIIQIPPLFTASDSGNTPNWSIVWGPVAYTTPGAYYQDSLMYVAQNVGVTNQYVIAIRGTNQISDLNWLMDDLDVFQQMPWPPGSSSPTGNISESTSVGLAVLLGMTDGDTSLMQFLAGLTLHAVIGVTVTGHSLGGALASALGLYLIDMAEMWNQIGASTVACVTFAAPTAGDDNFAGLIETAFPGTTLANTFDRVQCSLDIVPLAWTASNVVNSDQTSSAVLDIYDYYTDTYGNQQDGINFQEMEYLEGDGWSYIVLPYMLPSLQTMLQPLNYTQPYADAAQLTGNYNTAFLGL